MIPAPAGPGKSTRNVIWPKTRQQNIRSSPKLLKNGKPLLSPQKKILKKAAPIKRLKVKRLKRMDLSTSEKLEMDRIPIRTSPGVGPSDRRSVTLYNKPGNLFEMPDIPGKYRKPMSFSQNPDHKVHYRYRSSGFDKYCSRLSIKYAE